MKRSVLVALALALVLVVALFWTFSRPRPEAVTPDAGSNAVAAAPGDLDAPRRDGTQLDPVAANANARADAPAPTPAPAASGPTRTITGRVVVAGGCADPELEVFATDRVGGGVSLHELLDDPEHHYFADEDESTVETLKKRVIPRIVAHAPVDAQGAFRLEVPRDLTVQVEARGRYVSTSIARRVPVDETAPVLLAGDCGTCLVGRLVVSGASAETALQPARVRVRSTSDGDAVGDDFDRPVDAVGGRFELRAVSLRKAYEIDVNSDVLASARVEVTGARIGETREFDVPLTAGGVLTGVVQDAGGKPVAGASVVASRPGRWFGLDDRRVRAARTADDGTFRLAGVAAGDVRLGARADGYLDAETKKLTVADGATTEGLVLELGSGASVKGTVTWADGRPAAGARVVLEFDAGQMFGMNALNAKRGARGAATADAEGKFTIGGLGQGPFTVRAEALTEADAAQIPATDSTQRSKRMHRARRDGVKPGKKEIALELTAPQGLAGRVVEVDDTTPVKRFRVHAVLGKPGVLGDVGLDTVDESITSESGAFLVDLPRAGTWRVLVSGEGYATSDEIEVVLPRKADDGELKVTLARHAVVKGVVLDPRGQPVTGAEVDVATGDPAWKKGLPGWNRPRAVTRADGTFSLEGLRAGRIEIAASSASWAPSASFAIELATGETRENVELRLTEGGRLTGEVYEGGKPGANQFVQVTNPKTADQRAATTDADGHFKVEHLAPATYQVVAFPKSALGGEGGEAPNQAELMSKIKMASVTIVDGQEQHVVLGAPPVDPVRVHGRVTLAGAPYAGASVIFLGEGKDLLAGLKMASVGADGAYEIELAGPGRYSVTIQKNSSDGGEQHNVEFNRTVPAGKEYRLDFELPEGRISGRVRTQNGDPAAKMTVTIVSDEGLRTGTLMGGQYVTALTDADGRYDVPALRAGTYTVQAGRSMIESLLGTGGVTGRASLHGVRVGEREWKQDVDLRLVDPAAVRVTVVDEAGAPVSEASVFARDEEGRLVDLLSVVATDKEGLARYEGLGEGSFTFQARVKDRCSADSPRITLKAGETKDVRIELREGTRILVRVQDKDGAPTDATVRVFDESGRDVAAMFSISELQEAFTNGDYSRDVQRVGPLPKGTYRVKALREDGSSVEKVVKVTGQAEKAVTLKFEE